MTDTEKSKSFASFVDFYKKVNKKPDARSCTINATVTFKRDKIPETYQNREVILKNNTYGSSTVNLDWLDEKTDYTEFNTDFQKFEYINGYLKISGNSTGKTDYSEYEIIIQEE